VSVILSRAREQAAFGLFPATCYPSLGRFFAIWGIRFLSLLLAGDPTRVTVHAELNWHVPCVAAALSLLTGVLFGLAPALQSTHVDLASALKETGASQSRARHSFWGISVSQILVVGQIAA
jgi:macrolide transport system ATP-binding/permease protein